MSAERSRSLIYFCAFGVDEQFEMLSIAVRSLLTFGNSGADVAVLTSESRHDTVMRLLAPLVGGPTRFIVKHVAASTLSEYTSARYRIADFADLHGYGPVLYLDTDIVIDADIGGLLAKLTGTTGIAAVAEGRVLDVHEFWGRTLFLGDPSVPVTEETNGFSTGVLGAASIPALARPFRLVLDQIGAWLDAGHAPFEVYDQPHAVYTLIKHGLFEGRVLRPHIRVVGTDTDADPRRRRGITHFAGGVGRNEPKLRRMRTYLDALTG